MEAGAEIVERDEAERDLLWFREGREDAFEALFRRYQRAVYGWILRIVRDGGAAEDLTIETFFRIHQARARFDPARGFEPWARRIATNAARDWLRRQRPEDATLPEILEGVAARGEGDPAITAEIRRMVAAAFGRLPVKLRVPATLAVIEELPYGEIGAALGIAAGTAKTRVFRALRRLRLDLEEQGMKP